jgi:kynurenine formamidase
VAAYAPLSAQAAEYLTAKKIRALATDLPAIVRFDDIESRMTKAQPPEEVWAEYLPLFQAGIPIIAGWSTSTPSSRNPRSPSSASPFALPIADGAPVRAAALVY